MAEQTRVHAPYNFVPFSGKVWIPYERMEDLPRHDVWDANLKTGEIHVAMRAETPVFVSDGNKKDPHFLKGSNGKYMLPGASVRGMVRANMQILGFGLLCPGMDLDDFQIYFREMASARGSNQGELKQYYHAALNVKSGKNSMGRPVSTPENVRAGYIRCENGRYWISEASYLRVSRKHRDVEQFRENSVKKDNARTVPVYFKEDAGAVKKILPAEGTLPPDMKMGDLLYTGKPVGNKPNGLYLFYEEAADAERMDIPEGDILSYAEDWETRKNSLSAYYNADFWKLPGNGESKPAFYVKHEGHIYFGMSLFLRIGYKYPLSHGLPESHKKYWDESVKLDYPSAILGFANQDSSYRSRVSFGDCPAEGDPKEMKPVHMILGGPKPSYFPGYVKGRKHYNDDDFQLRGYKQYWLKDLEETAVQEGKEKVGTTLRPMPAGTTFRGVIRYRNLTAEELGLLLWSIRLDEGCFQQIGMGKPYGYGRIKLDIERLVEFHAESLYDGDLYPKFTDSGADCVDRYIKMYDEYAASEVGPKKNKKDKKPSKNTTICTFKEIQDFFFMKKTIQSGPEFSYMDLKEHKKAQGVLPEVESFRKEGEKKPFEQKPESMDDWRAALAAKFNPKH